MKHTEFTKIKKTPKKKNLVTESKVHKPNKRRLNEGVLDNKDDDGWMAKSQLYQLAKYAIELHRQIQDTDNLEPWVMTKIAQASDGIGSIKHHLEYKNVSEPQSELDLSAELGVDLGSMHEDGLDTGTELDLEETGTSFDDDETMNMEGPIKTKSGVDIFWDAVEGRYYKPGSGHISYSEWVKLNR